MKKSISILLVAIFLLSVCPIGAYAKDDEIKEVSQKIIYNPDGSHYFVTVDEDGNKIDLTDIDDSMSLSSTTVPSSYDSRDYNRVTSVKSQSPFGSCWAFAYCAVAESSLISQGYETKDSIDISEAHLIRFRSAYVENSTNPVQQEDYIGITDSFNYGGNYLYATATTARWSGFVNEADYPYSKSSSDMQFSMDKAFDSEYTIYQMRSLETSDYVKESIMNNGAVVASYYSATENYGWYSSQYTYYQAAQTSANHDIAIVGWDDNFSASNFNNTPSGNGAWLVKNSWGSSWGQSGYFWLSYYDASINNFTEVVAKPKTLDNNYQYSGLFCLSAISVGSTLYAANIFTATGNEKINACSFYTYNSSPYQITVSLYTNLTSSTNPKSGTLKETKTLTVDRAGFYQVDFNGSYSISSGQKFAIIIAYLNKPTSGSVTSYAPLESLSSSYCNYTISSGQSFYSTSGSSWSDCYKAGFGNFPIRAYSVDVPNSIEITKTPQTEYNVGDTLNTDNLEVTAHYSNKDVVVDNSKLSFNYDLSQAGIKSVTVSYLGCSASYSITVIDADAFVPSENTSSTIDSDRKILKCTEQGLTSLDGVFNVKNGYEYECSSYGTGGTVTIKKDGATLAQYQILIYGDITGDGYYNGQDAVIEKCIVAGMLSAEDIGSLQYEAADYNNDGKTDEDDVALIENAGIGV